MPNEKFKKVSKSASYPHHNYSSTWTKHYSSSSLAILWYEFLYADDVLILTKVHTFFFGLSNNVFKGLESSIF